MLNLTEKQKQDRRDAQRRWRERNPENAKKRNRDSEYRRKYGISLEQYDEMLKAQQGVCGICATSCDTGMNLAVDHCHDTNKVRGLLCHNCNRALRLFKDKPEVIQSAVDYIREYKIGLTWAETH
jgi:hypothetical protein